MLGAAVVTAMAAASARAQVAGSLSVTSDDRYRGVSISDEGPAVTAGLSYDAPVGGGAGAYGGASAIVGHLPSQGVALLGHSEYAGFAVRGAGETSWDVGVSNTVYAYAYYGHVQTEYAPELYAGFKSKIFRYYLHYSPRYFHDGAGALYAEVDAAGRAVGRWRLFAHVGVLTPLGQPGPYSLREQYDLRAGIATAFGPTQLSLAWTTRRPSSASIAYAGAGTDALVFTIAHSF